MAGFFLAAALAASDDVCPLASTWPPLQWTYNEYCEKAKITNLAPYREVVSLGDAGRPFVPVLSSLKLDGEPEPATTQAVIWIHGLLGDANNYFCDGLAAARDGGAENSTLTLAPWFGNETVLASSWLQNNDTHNTDAISLCWSGSHWISGGNDAGNISNAFAGLDLLVVALRQRASPEGRFPNLVSVSVAGFSAGCQLASRWAFFSLALDLPESQIEVDVLLGDCGSYLYFDEYRPVSKCSPLNDTGIHHHCDEFAIPNVTEEGCDGFDGFKYGLNFSDKDVAGNTYISLFQDSDALEVARRNFSQRNVRLLLGSQDSCQCQVPNYTNPSFCFVSNVTCGPSEYGPTCCDTYPDALASGEMPVPNVADFKCEAVLQGSNRLQRGRNWASYLEDFYARRGVNYKMPVTSFNGLHDGSAWARSPQFSKWVGWNDDVSSVVV